MQTKYVSVVLATVTIAWLNAGCSTTDLANTQSQANDIAEIRTTLKKQQEDIASLRKMLDQQTAAPGQEQLFNAAVLLAKNCPENQSTMAISIIGAFGGSKAESILLEMLETASPNQSSTILTVLSNMRSQKLHGIIIKLLESGNSQQFGSVINVLQNNSGMILKSDLPIIEKALENCPNNNYDNNRYFRNVLLGIVLRLDQNKGIQYLCDDLQSMHPNRKQEIIHLITNNNYFLRFNTWEKIIKDTGDIDNFNVAFYTAILQALGQTGDWRITDLMLPWAEFASSNDNFRRSYVDTLIRIKDPKAAKTILGLCDNSIKSGYLDMYPGIKKENGNYVLIDDAAMQKLLEQRTKRIEHLNELDNKRASKIEK